MPSQPFLALYKYAYYYIIIIMSPHDTWGAAGGAEHRARGAAAPLPPRWRRP